MSNHALKNLISTWGPRLARQTGLGGLVPQHEDFQIIQSIDFRPDECQEQRLEKKGNYKIAFIVAGMPAYSGGHTSLLRLGTYLTEFGHDVYYVDVTGAPVEALAKNAKINLPYYRGSFVERDGLDDEYDIGIATLWITAYYLYGRENFAYKCYFIQDFEPAFYPLGDLYYLALNTYRFNFNMISLGRWNAAQIQKHVGEVEINVIDFPFEAKQFPIQEGKISITDQLRVLAYIKMDPRRAPILIFQSLDLLARVLADRYMSMEVFVFGLDRRDKIPIGKNVGRLPRDELLKYYKICDLGVVASYSNISLITYEMIASGLPVIEFKDGSAPAFFDETQLVFCETNPRDFVAKVLYCIDHQRELETMLGSAQDNLRGKTWEKTARSFATAITSTQR